jgi:predicted phosphodiesterase
MKQFKNNNVLLIPDTHAPYHHKDSLDFLDAVSAKYQPDRVFHMGDWTDSYCFSRYPKSIEHEDTYTKEYKKVRKFTKDLLSIFPEGITMKGNHDARLWERAKIAGIPRGLVLPYDEVIGLKGTDWKMVYDYTFTVDATRQSWFLAHTKTSSAIICAKTLGMNVAFGHNHTKFLIESFQGVNKRLYGVTAGCLIGDNRYAFAYNRQSMVRPNRGCVMIVRGVPRLIPMDITPSGRWNKVIV